MATTQRPVLRVGDVATFGKLHYDTLKWDEQPVERDRGDYIETPH